MARTPWFRRLILCAGVVALTGCASPQRPALYAWGSYPQVVYDHLQGQVDGPEKQIATLEGDVEKARARNAATPPGVFAHLGMLYLSVGKSDAAARSWETEKSLFPESSRFMDFLLAKFKKGATP